MIYSLKRNRENLSTTVLESDIDSIKTRLIECAAAEDQRDAVYTIENSEGLTVAQLSICMLLPFGIVGKDRLTDFINQESMCWNIPSSDEE